MTRVCGFGCCDAGKEEACKKAGREGKLEICGVFSGYPGMAGMYILKTESREEAENNYLL